MPMLSLRQHIERRYLLGKNALERVYWRVFPVPRPNFNEEEIIFEHIHADVFGKPELSKIEDLAMFTKYNVFFAIQRGWVRDMWEYRILSGLLFAKRFPEHYHSKHVRKIFPDVTDEMIDELGAGRLRIWIEMDVPEKGMMRVHKEGVRGL